MANLTLIQAVNDGLKCAMRADSSIYLFGEDVGKKGGVFLATEGVQAEFGESRCFDTPLSEDGIVGAAIGMAMNGLKPIAEIQFQDFIFPAFDQIVSEAAKLRYRSGGLYTVPMVIRTPYGGGIRGGLYHSAVRRGATSATRPGLKVVIPSTPHDAKGLLCSRRSPTPTRCCSSSRRRSTARSRVTCRTSHYTVDLSTLRHGWFARGLNVTVFCYGAMVPVAEKAADQGGRGRHR